MRRSEALDGRGCSMTAAETERLFLRLALDRHRPRLLLPPFPKAVPPPPPPSQEQTEVRAKSSLSRPDISS